MSFLFRFASRFVAGEQVEQAMTAVQKLNSQGLTASLDILGENVHDKVTAGRAVEGYLNLLQQIHRAEIDSNISVKLTMTGLDIGDDLCFENMCRICESARSLNNYVRIDMEGSAYTERTLKVFFRLHAKYPGVVGAVIQAYLHRSSDDIDALNAVGARVRLCKGAYKEPPSAAIQKMRDIRTNYKRLAEKLFLKGVYPGIATHDDQLIHWTRDFVAAHGIRNDQFEFQMLYGIRPGTQKALVRGGHRMRVYVPFGTHWAPYFYRRLRERKENVWFIVSNMFKG
ncbi:MAG: proline dehydrogenase family protein [Acidobacteriia bacterium]|nr:proline dehydrogenase family protein [Terriglobia bacterium]